jgi:hypothetical protein
MAYSWIKLYHEILHDPKMARLSEHLWNLTIKVFLMAGENEKKGLLPPIQDMSWTLRIGAEELEISLHELESLKITALTKRGWMVKNFEKRQSAMSDAERQRVSRSKKKSVTFPSRHVTKNVQDIDKTREDKDKTDAAGKPANDFQKSQQLFIDKFCELTGIPEQDHKSKSFGSLWGGPSAYVVKTLNGSALEYLGKAVKKLRDAGMTISTPKSVVNTIMAIYGEKKTPQDDGLHHV